MFTRRTRLFTASDPVGTGDFSFFFFEIFSSRIFAIRLIAQQLRSLLLLSNDLLEAPWLNNDFDQFGRFFQSQRSLEKIFFNVERSASPVELLHSK